MHYFAVANTPGSSIDDAIGPLADDLARLILMIESGKRLFVNGQYVPAPHESFIFKDMGYCRVQMYIQSARIVLLCPTDSGFGTLNYVMDRIIIHINAAITKIQATYSSPTDRRTRRCASGMFASNTIKYYPTPSNFRRAYGSGGIEERIFLDGIRHSTNRETQTFGFTWNICDSFVTDRFGSVSQYADEQTMICLNLANRDQSAIREIPMPKDAFELIGLIAGANSKSQVVRVANAKIPWNVASDNFKFYYAYPKKEMKLNDLVVSTLAEKPPPSFSKVAADGPTLLMRILESKGEADPDHLCQVCMKPLWLLSYCISPSANRAFAVCSICANTNAEMIEVANTLPVRKFWHARVMADVKTSVFGLPADLSIPDDIYGPIVRDNWLILKNKISGDYSEILAYCRDRSGQPCKIALLD